MPRGGGPQTFRVRNSHAAKITQEQALWARERYAKGDCTQRQIADALGIGIAQAGKILRNEAWKQVALVQREPTAEEILTSQSRLMEMISDTPPPPVEQSALAAMEADIAAKKEPARKVDALIDELSAIPPTLFDE